jgi:hypothetical protein
MSASVGSANANPSWRYYLTEYSFSDAAYRNIFQISLLGVALMYIDMHQARTEVAPKHRTTDYEQQRTFGGTVASLLALPVLVAIVAAPTVAVGAVVGVMAVAVGRRVVHRLRHQQSESDLSPSEVTPGHPA